MDRRDFFRAVIGGAAAACLPAPAASAGLGEINYIDADIKNLQFAQAYGLGVYGTMNWRSGCDALTMRFLQQSASAEGAAKVWVTNYERSLRT